MDAQHIIRPIRLLPLYRQRPWGVTDLSPWFPDVDATTPVGEVWFTSDDNLTDGGERLGDLLARDGEAVLGQAGASCPLLVKFLFTAEKLSVQVHPDDEYAREHHCCLGKTEAWHVLRSEPQAEVAMGFRESLTPQKLRAAAESGEIEELLHWQPVRAGDTLLTPAGTVHAIGAGLTICEIQQNSDVTYRLYDYGRPRELHLDRGVAVAHCEPPPPVPQRQALGENRDLLATCGYFTIERHWVSGRLPISPTRAHYHLMICASGEGKLDGQLFSAGQVWLVPAEAETFTLESAGAEWLVAYCAKGVTEAFG